MWNVLVILYLLIMVTTKAIAGKNDNEISFRTSRLNLGASRGQVVYRKFFIDVHY